MVHNNEIKDLLGHLIGTKNTLSNNILFIDFTGSHEKAQLLSQMWYWSSRTKIKGGWFCKTHSEWFDEIRVKSHSVRRFTQEFCKLGFLENKLKKFDGVPKPHYRLDADELIRQLITFCEGNKLSTSQIVTLNPDNLQPSMEGNSVSPSINIDLVHRLNTESKEHAPAKNEAPSLTGLEKSPPPCSAPPPAPNRTRFSPPPVEEVSEYLEDLFLDPKWQRSFLSNPPETAEEIHDYYTSNGWKVGRNPMKDWRAACRNWLKNNRTYATKQRSNVSSAPRPERRIVSEDTHRRALAITLAELGITSGQ